MSDHSNNPDPHISSQSVTVDASGDTSQSGDSASPSKKSENLADQPRAHNQTPIATIDQNRAENSNLNTKSTDEKDSSEEKTDQNTIIEDKDKQTNSTEESSQISMSDLKNVPPISSVENPDQDKMETENGDSNRKRKSETVESDPRGTKQCIKESQKSDMRTNDQQEKMDHDFPPLTNSPKSSDSLNTECQMVKNKICETSQPKKTHQRPKDPLKDFVIHFHVLVKIWELKESKASIFFGPPLSPWKARYSIDLSPVQAEPVKIGGGMPYYYLTGVLPLDKKFKGIRIPYKYVLVKEKKVSWEQFHEDPDGDKLNRFFTVPDTQPQMINKYDDVISTDKYNHKDHTVGRENAFAIMLTPIFEMSELEEAVSSIMALHKAQTSQKVISNKREEVAFGSQSQHKMMVYKAVIHLVSLHKNKCPIKYCHVSVLVCLLFSELYLPEDKREHYGAIFDGFQEFMDRYNDDRTIFHQCFSFSPDFCNRILAAMVEIINDYLAIMADRSHMKANANWIYAFRFIRKIQGSLKYDEKIRFHLWEKIAHDKPYGINLSPILQSIQNSQSEDSFKYEFLKLSTVSHFRDIILSGDIVLFDPIQISEKLLHIFENQTLTDSFFDSIFTKLKHYLKNSVDLISPENLFLLILRLEVLTKKCGNKKSVVCDFSLEILTQILSRKDLEENIVEECREKYSQICDILVEECSRLCKQNSMTVATPEWSKLFNRLEAIQSDFHTEKLRDKFADHIQDWDKKKCLDVLTSQFSTLNPHVNELLINAIFEEGTTAIHQSSSKFDRFLETFRFKDAPEKYLKNLGQLISKMIKTIKVPSRNNNCHEVIQAITEKSYFCQIVKHHQTFKKFISESALSHLQYIFTNTDLFLDCLKEGKLTLTSVRLLTEERRRAVFLEIFAIKDKHYDTLVTKRIEELNCVAEDKKNVESFIKFFKDKTKANLFDQEGQIDFKEEDTFLNKVCHVRRENVLESWNQPPKLTFHFSTEDIRTMKHFIHFRKSQCFNKMFTDLLKNETTDEWEFGDVINFARGVVKRFVTFCEKLSSGTIPLSEVKTYFRTSESNLQKELQIIHSFNLNTQKNWLDVVQSKIDLFFKTGNLKEIASTLLEVVKTLGASVTLEALERIVKLAGETDRMLTKPLNYLSSEVMEFGKLFKNWNRFVLPALKEFISCTTLVKWIRENIKSTQEFKVFIDLANISAGESDIEVDRVLCFQSSVTAYYGLLFDCKSDFKFEQLLEAVNSLNTSVARDPKIADKFRASSQHIGWIKLVKERHGSVETSSLNMVQQINATGHFNVISKEIANDEESIVEVTLTYNETLENEVYEKCVTLKALIELESKLMLISVNPEMRNEVDRFLETLHNVDRIQNELSGLITHGCCLFSELSITIFMGKKKEVSLSVDFGHKTGILRGTAPVDQELSMLISFMQISRDEWNNYMSQLRSNTPELSVFTADQLVCLSRFLADIESNNSAKFAHEPMMLMNLLSRKVTLEHIKEALQNIDNTDDSSQECMSVRSETDDNSMAQDLSRDVNTEALRVRQTIHEEYGIDLEHIDLAIKSTRSFDEEKIAQWCLSNPREDDSDMDVSDIELEAEEEPHLDDTIPEKKSREEDIRAFIRKVSDDYGFPDTFVFAGILLTENVDDDVVVAEWCYHNPEQEETIDLQKLVDSGILTHEELFGSGPASTRTVAPMDYEITIATVDSTSKSQSLQCKLFDNWNKFLQSNNVTKAEDFVSFKKLSLVVEQLSNKFFEVVDRKILPCLKEGQPNLVVVKEEVIYESTLLLYLHDKAKPLPSIDEILICDENTTEEKLILHCSKAFHDKQGRLFVILHADRLSFQNCEALEKLFKRSVENHKYRLVFICSKENDDTSYISTLFQKHKVSGFPDMRKRYDELRSYLFRHLQSKTRNRVDPTMSRFRLIASFTSGNGKSLIAERLSKSSNVPKTTFTIHSDRVDKSKLIGCCFKKLSSMNSWNQPRVYHFDISPVVRYGIKDLMFSLAILEGLNDYKGRLWLSSQSDVCLTEVTMVKKENDFFSLFPTIWCQSPKESLNFYQLNPLQSNDQFYENGPQFNHYMDYLTFLSDELQRPYQFLDEFVRCRSLDNFFFDSGNPNGSVIDFLTIFLDQSGIADPSWMELSNFWKFLNVQLMACERSHYCNPSLVGDALPTFKLFVVKFMIKMAKDFSTRSATISDESFPIPEIPDRNRWENNPHPYLFFNEDGHTISFFGFYIINGDLIDDRNGVIIEPKIMSKELQKGLSDQRVEFCRQISAMPQASVRYFYLEQLCMVFGINQVNQFDDEYELTADNVLKILAIHMRFRSRIPVVIMGETGTGKTRLIRFMCDLQKQGSNRENLIILKCHGGTQECNVYAKVRQAIKIAKANFRHGVNQTVLFFDEANTTSAIGAIKEVMCDNLIEGEPIPDDIGLKFVAAVNPYREHSREMIKKLENAGLGYHMKAENTQDRLGRIPMRRLVYRVKELPLSLVPFIWDFGILDNDAELKYIVQMIENSFKNTVWTTANKCLLMELLTTCQKFMRRKKDECSFVSLRDVERCLKILRWFHEKHEIIEQLKSDCVLDESFDNFILVTILAIGCAYYVRLDERETFCQEITLAYQRCNIEIPEEEFFQSVIEACQDLFVKELKLQPTISKNEALKENVWIMAICIELRIPLFLVGKPGSSKSLAKTVVSDVMQGDASYSKLFKTFKEIQLVSFQCSPLATADGILTTFRQCQKYQQKQYLNKFVSVVVLDEVGLAEDSPKMPLKALHPLLEDGCVDDEPPENYKRVGFVGISNWALDPAKMNRGIYVSRGKLSKEDLIKTALGICEDDDAMTYELESMLEDIVDSYLTVYTKQDREYYGLRDFYSLIKMLYANFQKDREITADSLKLSICRCFGGEFGSVKASDVFISKIRFLSNDTSDVDPSDVIKSALAGQAESRYLLFLTKSNSALSVLQDSFSLINQKVSIIFGSSFSRDQQYIQLCKNINRIKLSMEMGHTVILCNLTNLYESLYDALNQSYVEMGGSRYVDLGLGIHRVKCRVHELFRLIVVAEDKEVLDKFPIPLLNRLEKHYLGVHSLLLDTDFDIVDELASWICRFAEVSWQTDEDASHEYTAHDVFIGYHEDVPANIVFHIKESIGIQEEEILTHAKSILMRCAVPDSLIRLASSELSSDEVTEAFDEYSRHRQHNSLVDFISSHESNHQSLLQVTTYSRLLTGASLESLAADLGLHRNALDLKFLHQIETQEQFKLILETFLKNCTKTGNCGILFIQCHVQFKSQTLNLIECARYIIEEITKSFTTCAFTIVFLIRIHRTIGGNFVGFPSSAWIGIHLDELFTAPNHFDLNELKSQLLSEVIAEMNIGNLRALIAEALPSSCASNDAIAPNRIIDQIGNFQEVLNSDHSVPFIETIRKIISRIQSKCENSKESKKWLLHAATTSIYLHEGHTFQQALRMTITDHIGRHLATLLSYLDAYYGLTHLTAESQHHPWKHEFYMEFISQADFASEDFTPPVNPPNFKCEFPFFWHFVDFFEKICDQSGPNHDCNTLLTVINNTELGTLIRKTFMNVDESASNSFASDILLLNWPIAAKHPQLQSLLVKELIAFVNMNIVTKRDDGNLEIFQDTIQATDIYLALTFLRDQLSTVVKAVEVCDFDTSNLTGVSENEESKFDLDDKAIDALLLHLEPRNLDIADQSKLRAWINKVNLSKFIIQSYLHNQPEERRLLMEHQTGRLDILKLYVQHVICDFDCDDVFRLKIRQSLKRFTLMLKKSCNFKSNTTFQQFMEELIKLSDETAKALFSGGVDKCFICLEDINNPVALPCKHVSCFECIKNSIRTRTRSKKWNCPKENCSRMYKDDFKPTRTTECDEAVSTHRKFRNKLNTFFLEVLQLHVFYGDDPPEKQIISTLLKFVVAQELPKRKEESTTKNFGLFSGDCIDSSPVVRSFIFQMLLRGDWTKVNEFITEIYKSKSHFADNSKIFKAELCLLLVYSMEDSLGAKCSKAVTMTEHQCANSSAILNILNSIPKIGRRSSFMEYLEFIAKIRFCVTNMMRFFNAFVSENQELSEEEIGIVELLITTLSSDDNDCVRKFFVKELAMKFRTDSISSWKQIGRFLDLMPQSLRQVDLNYVPDIHVMLGQSYIKLRNTLLANLYAETASQVAIKTDGKNLFHYRMANFYLLAKLDLTNDGDQKSEAILIERENAIQGITDEQKRLSKSFLQIIRGSGNPRDRSIYTISFFLYEILQQLRRSPENSVVKFFHNLCFNGALCTNQFFPTMPQDDDVEARQAVGDITRLYYCPNGHAYGVGDCGQLNGSSICPTCRLPIGRGQANAAQAQLRDTTQSGHILGAANSQIIRMRNLDNAQVAIVRFLMHSAMFLNENKREIGGLIRPQVAQDINQYLLEHMRSNLSQLAAALGKSEDQAQVLLHSVILSLNSPNGQVNGNLSSKQHRAQWETAFSQAILQPCIAAVDQTYRNYQKELKIDQNAGQNMILQLLQKKEPLDSFNLKNLPFLPPLWIPRHQITLENMSSLYSTEKMMTECPLFTVILENRFDLQYLSNLIPIIQLQTILINKFNKKLDTADLEGKTIREFLFDFIKNGHEREKVKALIEIYLKTFNSLRQQIFSFDQCGVAASKHYMTVHPNNEPATINHSPCAMIFPALFGHSLTASVTVQFLIDKHNTIIKRYTELTDFPVPTVTPSDIDSCHLIDLHIEELSMLLLLNCRYTLKPGETTKPNLDIQNLERQVINRYFIGRTLLDKRQVPRLQLIQEEQPTANSTFSIDQIPLGNSLHLQIESSVSSSAADVSTILYHCFTIRKLLSFTNPSSLEFTQDHLITDVMKQFHILIPEHIASSRFLDNLRLAHLDDLILFLKVLRAKLMLFYKQNPWYGFLDLEMQETFDPALKKDLNLLLQHVAPHELLSRLYRFMESMVSSNKASGDFSLGESIYWYLFEFEDEEADRFQEHLPEDILVKHCAACFTYFVEQINTI